MKLTRRSALLGMSATALGFAGLRALGGRASEPEPTPGRYGRLVRDPDGLLDLPPGFSYRIVSRTGDRMSDGLLTPGAFDGMACFPVPGSSRQVALVRNHELWPDDTAGGAFGADHALVRQLPRAKLFDFTPDGEPKLGATTTLIWDLRAGRLVRSHLSLAGTCANCAGGPTPWGSWLSCEETIEQSAPLVGRPHGFVFEVPATAPGLVDPVPLTAMGRFIHEAAAVDPRTGIVYLSEDQPDGLLYRFLPHSRGQLAMGGRLQALGLVDGRERDFRNWPDDGDQFAGAGTTFRVGQVVPVRWIDLDGVDSPAGDLKDRGFARGALRFARGEGLAVGASGAATDIYLSCTMGGPARIGQIWRYRANPGAEDPPGRLQLFVESTDPVQLKYCDNLAIAPWGDLLVCEDGPDDDESQFVRGVTPDGRLYTLARNAYTEFAGACFSPDGSTLFVNAQTPGITFAVTGPWRRRQAG